jgi:hypothetical protein
MNYEFNRQVQIGDWVSGSTGNDERYHGFVEAVLADGSMVHVRVTASDHERLIGRTIEGPIRKVEVIPSGGPVTEGHLLNLIDLALSVKDEKWFYALSARLRNLREASGTLKPKRSTPFRGHSRRMTY